MNFYCSPYLEQRLKNSFLSPFSGAIPTLNLFRMSNKRLLIVYKKKVELHTCMYTVKTKK